MLYTVSINAQTLFKLLAALNECTEWGQVFILDSLTQYDAKDSRDAESIIERVLPRLQHANCAVVLGAVKVILKQLDAVDDEGNTVMHHMAHYMEHRGFVEGINMLLDAGASIEVQNYEGDYPLDIAKRYKDNYHRLNAHPAALDLLGFNDEDFNENYDEDMRKVELDAMIDPDNLPYFPERPMLSMD